jgi:hypothetical protein
MQDARGKKATKWGTKCCGARGPGSRLSKLGRKSGPGWHRKWRWDGMGGNGKGRNEMEGDIPLTSIQNTFANDIRSLARSEKVVRNPGSGC